MLSREKVLEQAKIFIELVHCSTSRMVFRVILCRFEILECGIWLPHLPHPPIVQQYPRRGKKCILYILIAINECLLWVAQFSWSDPKSEKLCQFCCLWDAVPCNWPSGLWQPEAATSPRIKTCLIQHCPNYWPFLDSHHDARNTFWPQPTLSNHCC